MSTEQGPVDSEEVVRIGRSETAMWMRIVSSWVCMLLYMWSLLAPVLMPDRQVILIAVIELVSSFLQVWGYVKSSLLTSSHFNTDYHQTLD